MAHCWIILGSLIKQITGGNCFVKDQKAKLETKLEAPQEAQPEAKNEAKLEA